MGPGAFVRRALAMLYLSTPLITILLTIWTTIHYSPATRSPEDEFCTTTGLVVENLTALLGDVSVLSKLESPKLDEWLVKQN